MISDGTLKNLDGEFSQHHPAAKLNQNIVEKETVRSTALTLKDTLLITIIIDIIMMMINILHRVYCSI